MSANTKMKSLSDDEPAESRGGLVSTSQISPNSEDLYSFSVASGGGCARLIDDRPTKNQKNSKGQADRQEITDFSKRSRRNMRRTLLKLDRDEARARNYNTLFVTLTYPQEFPENKNRIKKDWDTFSKRLDRKLNSAFWAWKLEAQKRGAPHFHLVLFTKYGDLQDLKGWVSANWADVVRKNSGWSKSNENYQKNLVAGTRIDFCGKPDEKGVIGYMTDYSAKKNEYDSGHRWGERWGVRRREKFDDLVDWVAFALNRKEFLRARRTLKRWLKSKGYDRACEHPGEHWWYMKPTVAAKLVSWLRGPPDRSGGGFSDWFRESGTGAS